MHDELLNLITEWVGQGCMKGNPPSEVMAAGAAEGTSQFSGILAATMSAVGGAVTSGGSTVMKLLGGREHGSEEDDDHEQVRRRGSTSAEWVHVGNDEWVHVGSDAVSQCSCLWAVTLCQWAGIGNWHAGGGG